MQNVMRLLRRSGKEKREEGEVRRERFYLKEAWAPFSSDHFRVAPPFPPTPPYIHEQCRCNQSINDPAISAWKHDKTYRHIKSDICE
jgi:hypothetical protein